MKRNPYQTAVTIAIRTMSFCKLAPNIRAI
jgi:hypothetical protein